MIGKTLNKKSWILIALISISIASITSVVLVNANRKPNILILNSNQAVPKYAIPHQIFKEKMPFLVTELDVTKHQLDERAFEELILDENPDLIYAIGAKAYRLAYRKAEDIPIVFSSILNWQRLPRGQKTYGISNELYATMLLATFKFYFPNTKTLGVIASKKYNAQWLKIAQKAATESQITLHIKTVDHPNDVTKDFSRWAKDLQALWLVADPVVLKQKSIITELFQLCDQQRLPVYSYSKLFMKFGATLVVQTDNKTIGYQAAILAKRIVTGKKMRPLQYPAGSEVLLNMRKVTAYQLDFNYAAMSSINEIIQ